MMNNEKTTLGNEIFNPYKYVTLLLIKKKRNWRMLKLEFPGSKPCRFSKIKNEDKTTAYSSLLSDDAAVYEVIVEDVKPKDWDKYLQHKGISKCGYWSRILCPRFIMKYF